MYPTIFLYPDPHNLLGTLLEKWLCILKSVTQPGLQLKFIFNNKGYHQIVFVFAPSTFLGYLRNG